MHGLKKITSSQNFSMVLLQAERNNNEAGNYYDKIMYHKDRLLEDLEFIKKKIKETDSYLTTIKPFVKEQQIATNILYDDLAQLIKKDTHQKASKDAEKKEKRDDDIDDNHCSICFEKYNKEKHQRACIVTCGHQFCHPCIQILSGTCPSCRKTFKKDKIIKLY